MTKTSFFIILGILLVTFTASWGAAMMTYKHKELNHISQAIPVIRFERFDKDRNALIIGLFNPGSQSIEIDRTKLYFQAADTKSTLIFNPQEYIGKPLVLDPGDTILVPLHKDILFKSSLEKGDYWGELEFRVPGQVDYYSLRHQSNSQLLIQQSAIQNGD